MAWMRRPASVRLVLLSIAGALSTGCSLPPEVVTCEEETACPPSTSSGASGSTASSGAEGDTGTSTSGSTSTGTMADSTGASTTTDADATTSSTGGETTGMEAFCGDGVVNQDFEECDDGAPSPDGPCSPLCQRERIIFVVSLKLNGKLSGLQGADAYCKSQAFKAQEADPTSPIKDAKNFKALLPSSTASIFSRHFRGEGRYRLINGLTVSDSFEELFSEPLQVAINVDEFGQTNNTCVWTASTADGQPYPGVDFCGDWTGVKGSASHGWSDRTDAGWIEFPLGQPTIHCAYDCALYCVEQQ